jgi:hypothetical protein
MTKDLSEIELVQLIQSVFPAHPDDHSLAILVDIPRNVGEDTEGWKQRRRLAQTWHQALAKQASALHLDEVKLVAYPDVASNNADLPEDAYLISQELPDDASLLGIENKRVSFSSLFLNTQILLAPTQYSTTAPLKMAAKKFDFRAATMPGFSETMIPTLKLDYNEVNRRVLLLKEKLDVASSAQVQFLVDEKQVYQMVFDLRYRLAHASTGRFPTKGTAGNLPSGEAYIVPYEGEKEESSQTEGMLPVQIGEDVVLFKIEENRAVGVEGRGPSAFAEHQHLKKEPAYGNMAELGFGVLEAFGIEPVGKILLDEKLGFHIAFGRSEHFGGIVGPKDFSSPEEVIHLDRIYIPATQPRIIIKSLILQYEDNRGELIMENSRYLLF